ncbi:PLDc N-terminal domain-containing protein [Paenarthrobacter sp. YJN-5]|uniref:PLDc N-terminal domain-containing protein n=1 Tax=Paenarthrobacter sp. YJN-5 TaxID=2735316 RepID=UPI001D0C101A|nr:PLDc N-terminal domain-containing protein [Paenarthrobacter sp. YJN-5]
MASILWSIFDVRKDDRLDQTTTAWWLFLLLAVPLLGLVAWLYARQRLGPHADSLHFKKLP